MCSQPDLKPVTISERIDALRKHVTTPDSDAPSNERRMDGPQFEKWGKEGPMPWKQEQWNKLSS